MMLVMTGRKAAHGLRSELRKDARGLRMMARPLVKRYKRVLCDRMLDPPLLLASGALLRRMDRPE